MFYEVRATLYFLEQDEAEDFYHDCEKAMLKSEVINPGTDHAELPQLQVLGNHHDTDPAQPCDLLRDKSVEY